MTSRPVIFLAGLGAILAASASSGQVAPSGGPGELRASLARAIADQKLAAARAGELERSAAQARESAERTARTGAALAARIQQAESEVAEGEARLALLQRQRAVLRESLGARQAPLVRLTGALQLMARRPLALAVLQPGSLRDTVHLRAVLDTMMPVIRRRSEGLRAQLVAARRLALAVRHEQAGLRRDQETLGRRRTQLAALETRQRLEMRARQGDANREADRALALAEQARDLSGLAGMLERSGALRRELAALPGPVLRPPQPGLAVVRDAAADPAPAGSGIDYILPVVGTVVSGFGEGIAGGARSQGVMLAVRGGAQVVAPAAGRIAFAGRYRGYGQIVIIEHDGGWTTLITNLAGTGPSVGDRVVQGSPLGIAPAGTPRVTVELRKDGRPVDLLGVTRSR